MGRSGQRTLSLLSSPFSLLPSPFSLLPSPFSVVSSLFSLLSSLFSLLFSLLSLLFVLCSFPFLFFLLSSLLFFLLSSLLFSSLLIFSLLSSYFSVNFRIAEVPSKLPLISVCVCVRVSWFPCVLHICICLFALVSVNVALADVFARVLLPHAPKLS